MPTGRDPRKQEKLPSPDSLEGNASTDESKMLEMQVFWNDRMRRHGNEKQYLESIINAFNHNDDPEILIVIDKLLTGFGAPRNSVLYLNNNLKKHNILQAIVRVNRLWDGKDYGLEVDYRGFFGALNEAIDTYAPWKRKGPTGRHLEYHSRRHQRNRTTQGQARQCLGDFQGKW